MTTVFAVEQGEYSDYRIVGIFSSLDKAEQVANALNDGLGSWATAVEMPVDPFIDQLNQGLQMYDVHMRKDGGVVRAFRINFAIECYYRDKVSWIKPWPPREGEAEVMIALVWAKDEKHAVKIVNEKRIERLALNLWGRD